MDSLNSPPSRNPGRSISVRRTWWIVQATVRAYQRDKLGRLSAALAFYTTVAVAPLLALVLMLADLVLDDATARQRIISEIGQLAGAEAGRALHELKVPIPSTAGPATAIVGVVALLIGGLGVFIHLQETLNEIWRVRPKAPGRGGNRIILAWHRLVSVATVMATGFILLVSLVVSAMLTWLDDRTFTRLAWPAIIAQGLNVAFSFASIALLLTLILKLMPDTKVNWRDAWVGGIVTAFAFNAGKYALSFYLARASARSSIGIAGPVVALLLWAYYAAQILFVGAEITRLRVLARKRFADPKPGRPA
jgi:membrane protein